MTNDEIRAAIKAAELEANHHADLHDQAVARRDQLIREALSQNVAAEDIAQDIGRNRSRIYQIRDNRR
ncbi:hypothetical protein [Actinoplanes rectilineatus]|uniref:hypothetical protein n=1 Tax=Actinoplanes rectilineatus TaxID=113571 RepID=UPI0005F2AB64|nr:hypothetical protein [Actinoplanes rectilineatus]